MNEDWKIGKTYEELYGKERAKEMKEQRSKKTKENHLNGVYKESHKKTSKSLKGKKFTLEHRKKLSAWQIGKIVSEKTKQKQSEARKLRRESLGYLNSPETRKKISNTLKGHYVSEETKKKIKDKRALQITPLKDTTIEVKIQNFLKLLGIEFFTHQRINIKHSYQCDILIPSMNLVIECDGDYWHKYPTGKDIDSIRTKELIQKGFKVLRLWEIEIKNIGLEEFKLKFGSSQFN